MTQEIIRLSPDALGYKDRGKMKWMGMMLSDHAEALKKQTQANQQKEVLPKKKMPLEDMGAFLHRSYTHKKPVAIQLDVIKDGRYMPDIEGFVIGYKEKNIFIKLKDHTIKALQVEELRHIEWIDAAQWFEKYERQKPEMG
ncbi:hypothetical protein [Alkalibacterium sp. MB6]|uniref:hypothetical protein n=1 Tax=Alkalibacterium sp. MB6 TaxID=2081965 RepID=UPI00137976CC|nr:hypothetical protein [Alkalibacterium sp. MB6]